LRSAAQGEKFGCALDGRYGYWKSSGYWNPVDGNGGNPTRGMFLPNYAHPVQPYPAGAATITVGSMPSNAPQMWDSAYRTVAGDGFTADGFWVSFVINGKIYRASSSNGGFLPMDQSGQFTFTGIKYHVGTRWLDGIQESLTPSTNIEGHWTLSSSYYDEMVVGGAKNQQAGAVGYYSGWSCRIHTFNGWGEYTNDPAKWAADQNPYKHLHPLHVYFYNPQQVGVNGESAGTDLRRYILGSRATGYPLLAPGKAYSIELRCKMNSLAGSADAWGNRAANRDGLVEVWVEGIKVKSLTDCVFRHHANIKIKGSWLDFYLGGSDVPWGLIAPCRRTLGPHVTATQYIGPLKVS
jgi:hypothetical protein